MRSSLIAAAISISLLGLGVADEVGAAARRDTNIPAEGLEQALQALAEVHNFQVLYRTEIVGTQRTQGAVGEYTPEEALKQLLRGTGLTYRFLDQKTITIVPASAAAPAQRGAEPSSVPASPGIAPKEEGKSAVRPFLVAQGDVGQAAADVPLERPESQEHDLSRLQEIVVTAQKRESTVQTTPISITAVTGAEIEARGLADFTALAQSIPGISMKTSGPGQTEFEMRGMTSGGGFSPTVGFYLNDTPLTAPAFNTNGKVVIDPNLYDLNRVEVLRGPQGTLYGSGSMGGTIKIVPNAPNPRQFEASTGAIFSVTDGGGFNHGENAMLNIPFAGGTAALRIVGSHDSESGWIDRVVIANGRFPLETNSLQTRGNLLAAPVAADYQNVNDERLTSIRVSLLWQPIDRLTLEPTYFYQRIEQGGLSYIDSDPGTNAHYEPFDVAEPFSDRIDLASLDAKYALDAFEVTSTTSRWTRDELSYQDGTEEFQWAFSTPDAILPFYPSQGGLGAVLPAGVEDDRSRQTSEELRASSIGSTRLEWLLGYFYSDFAGPTVGHFYFPAAVPLFGTANAYTGINSVKVIQNSLFGEITYHFTPTLKGTVGVRRYAFNSSFAAQQSGFILGPESPVNSVALQRAQGASPKATLSYSVSEDLMLYATAAQGFRPGGGNLVVQTSGPDSCEAGLQALEGTTAFVPSPHTFKPDSVWSYELGEKARIFDGRLTLNAAGYFEKWSNVQQYLELPCGAAFTSNAGVAHIYGGELEINALLAPGLTLGANTGYTHARIVSSAVNSSFPPGTPIQDVPDWTASLSLAFRRPISDQLALISRFESNYVGPRTDVTYGTNHVPSYDLSSIRAGIEGNRWKAQLFAKNVFDRRAFLDDVPQVNLNIPTFYRIAVSQPRTIGIDFSYQFGR